MIPSERPNIGNDWLANHFRSKSHRRFRQVGSLDISPGNSVLDLGCGPGHYATLIANLVGPAGRIVGIDSDEHLISTAQEASRFGLFNDIVSYMVGDISSENVLTRDFLEQFDVILIFNTLPYLDEPLAFLNTLAAALKPGARVIMKSSDFSHLIVEPFSQPLLHRVIDAARGDSELEYNNFFGRLLPGLAANAFKAPDRNSIDVWSYPVAFPATVAEHRYIQGNLASLGKQAEPRLCASDITAWREATQEGGAVSIYNSIDFFFLMHEIVVTSTVIASP